MRRVPVVTTGAAHDATDDLVLGSTVARRDPGPTRAGGPVRWLAPLLDAVLVDRVARRGHRCRWAVAMTAEHDGAGWDSMRCSLEAGCQWRG